MDQLPPILKKGPFTLGQAAKQGVTRYQLGKLVTEGTVELVTRGIYRVSKDDYSEVDQYQVATLLVGPTCAICLISALSYHRLTDTIPKKIWVMVPMSKRSRYPELKLLRTRNPRWSVGIEKHKGHAITSLERTIVDTLCARLRIGTQIGIEALRRAIQTKKTTLGKVMDMGNQLKVAEKIRPYIEALS